MLLPYLLSAAGRMRLRCVFQDLLSRYDLHQPLLIQEVCWGCLALAEEFFRLVVPMTAFLVIALAQGNDSVGLRRIAEHHYLSRSLSGVAYHFLAGRRKRYGARRRHRDVRKRSAADGPGSVSTSSTNAKIFAIRNVEGVIVVFKDIDSLHQAAEQVGVRNAFGRVDHSP